VVVLHGGQILADGAVVDVFHQAEVLARTSLALPPVMKLAEALRPHGFRGAGRTVDAFCDEYMALARGAA
jgi:hypothetical protein